MTTISDLRVPIGNPRHQGEAGLEKIGDMRMRVEVEGNRIGARNLVEAFYSPRPPIDNHALDRWKEEWTLCGFVEQYNRYQTPALVWARRNPESTKRADFSVFARDGSFLCEIEITTLWSKPTVNDPQGYEDFSPYPTWKDPSNPDVRHLDIDRPPKNPPYGTLKRVLKGHLRDHYPPYWLVIYDNDHGVTHPNLDNLGNRVCGILEARAKLGKLPPNLQEVWLFDPNAPKPKQVFNVRSQTGQSRSGPRKENHNDQRADIL